MTLIKKAASPGRGEAALNNTCKPKFTPSGTAGQDVRNKSDPDRRMAARLHDSLLPKVSRTFEAMEIYKRLHELKEIKP